MNHTFNWTTEFANGGEYAFDPVHGDKISFASDPLITAATLIFDTTTGPTGNTIYLTTYDNKTVHLDAAPGEIGKLTFVFFDGSQMLVGDQGIGTINDDLANTLAGTVNNDQLLGLGGNDTLNGGGGADYLDGGAGDDTLNGGAGVDVLIDREGNNVFSGGTENDFFFAYTSGGGSDTATGGAGQDTYYIGTAAANYVVQDFAVGGSGDFVNISGALAASALAGFYQGGDPQVAGFLELTQSGSDVLVQYDLDGPGAGFDFVTVLTLSNRTSTGLQAANISGYVLGDANNNALAGDDSNQVLFSAAGNDTLDGGGGGDTMFGGAGDDVYGVDNIGDRVSELLGAGNDLVQAGINFTLPANVEQLALTGGANLAGTGNDLDNVLTGNTGDNVLTDDVGNDTLDGGTGNDSLTGGVGNDVYGVDAVGDVVTEQLDGGTDTVMSSITYALGPNLENLTLTGTDPVNGTGNAVDNVMIGNDASNLLDGAAGADSITGLGGNDILKGISGKDVLDGGDGGDKLFAGAGNDILKGGVGADKLYGGTGNDRLTGGGDADKFYFDSAFDATTNKDTILDFNHAQKDKIVLDDDIFTNFVGETTVVVGKFYVVGDPQPQDANDYIVYDPATGELAYDPDGSGLGGSTVFAVLGTTTHPVLVNTDFLVVA